MSEFPELDVKPTKITIRRTANDSHERTLRPVWLTSEFRPKQKTRGVDCAGPLMMNSDNSSPMDMPPTPA